MVSFGQTGKRRDRTVQRRRRADLRNLLLHVPVSDPVHPRSTFLTLLSADTDHSFWVPRLGGKTDLIPSRPNQMWMDPRERGVFPGQCAQYGGAQHAKMLLRVYVQSPEAFEQWVHNQLHQAVRDASSRGRQVFESTACLNCQAVSGTLPKAVLAPPDSSDEPRHHRRRGGREHS